MENLPVKINNIFDLIQCIHHRPLMYIGKKSLEMLETFLWGYKTALHINNIEEIGAPSFKYFYDWLKYNHSINVVAGLKGIIEKCESEDEAFELFFQFADEFSHLEIQAGESFNLPAYPRWSDDFCKSNPGLKNDPVPSQFQVMYLRPGNYCYLKYGYSDKEVLSSQLYSDLESAFFSINWKFDTQFK